MRKRITSLLLTLVMLLSLVPAMGVTAFAEGASEDAPIVVNTYAELKRWMENDDRWGNYYLKIGQDIDTSTENSNMGLGPDEIIQVHSNIYLDLNGKKVTLFKRTTNTPYFIQTMTGSLSIKDSGNSGEFIGVNQTNWALNLFMIGSSTNFTLESGKVSLKINREGFPARNAAIVNSSGNVAINGGEINVTHSNNRREVSSNIESENYALLVYSGKTSITAGTFNSHVLFNASEKHGEQADHVITGGNFKESIYLKKNVDVKGALNVSVQGGTYYYTPGTYTIAASPGQEERTVDDPEYKLQFATLGFAGKDRGFDWPVSESKPVSGFDTEAFASIFPKNALIFAKGQTINYLATRLGTVTVSDATYSGSDQPTTLINLLNSKYKTIEVTTIPENSLNDMKLTVGDGTPLPAQGTSTVPGDVTLGSDGTLTKTVYISALGNKQLKEMYYSNPSKIDFGYRLNIFKNGNPVTDYTGHGLTYAALGDEISVSVQLQKFKFEEGVYTFRLGLYAYLRGSEAQIGKTLVGLWKLTAKEEPPAPVAHSIKIINGFGTATPSTAMAGDPVTVKAKDRTAENMMFTQWYTETAGVTFADVTKQETTFVMPDCDVKVNPGYHGVSFTKQPTGSWLSSVDDSKVYFAFSQPITSWKLVNEDDTTLASGDAESANALVAATLGPKPNKTEMTCRVIVTANGQNFTSNEFTLKWYNVPGAPDVTVYPAGGKFVETLDVNLKTPNTYWEILYTTDGSDPYDKSGTEWVLNPSAKIENDSTQVKISKDTTIKACLYNSEGYSNMEKFGDIVTCNFTKVELTPPVADPPSGTSFYDSLNVSLSTDIVNAKIMVSYNNGDVDDLSDPNQWKEYEPEKESITLSGSYGMHGFDAVTGIQMEHLDGYTYWVHSDKQEYLYPRISYATIADASVVGKVNKEITPVDVSITLSGDVFAEDLTAGTDVSGWFTNLPAGLTAKVKERTNYTATLVITISGTPTATSAAAMSVEMPKSALRYTGTGTAVEQTVRPNSKAVYNIVEDGTHTHIYGDWTMLDDSQHSRSCTCGDVQFEGHTFSTWMKDNEATHSRHCTVCKKTDGSDYTETANHNWQWVVDAAATPNADGKQHEECVDCHAKRKENTVIPMLTSIMVEHLTVAKPVKDIAAAMASTTDSTYYVANTEWMAKDGTPLAIGGKFQPGTVYTVKITLETADAGVFSVKSTYNTIDGKTATVSPNLTGDAHADSVILTYTFDATEGTYVPTKPAITTATLPDGKVGEAYSQTLAATGTNPITWGIEAGTLPNGLTLVGDTIKGTPSKAGEFKFTVKATNDGGSATKELTIKVADAEAAKYHNVTLTGAGTGATGAGSHAAGTTVNIYAGTKSGYTFNGWTSDDVTVLSASSKNASFVMPDKDVTVKASWVYNGGGSSGGGYTYYTIKATAGVNGSISPTGNVSVREGRDQTFTITPNKGYAVAKVLIDSKNVGAVKSYTFENVKKNHTIEVVFMKASGNPQTGVFVDVPEGSYYEEAVNWAVEKGITTGTDATHFSPDGICTRAQAVTFLWRAAGSPAAKSAVMPFTDVKAGSYYYDAVLWAVENGITKGTSETMFSPDATCSRAQIVTFLWRSQKSPAAGTANPFTDVKASAYYADAVLWAVKEDVTKGTTNTTFSPDANCTRAQIVTFIWRALAE